ncbi:RNA polymerase II-associated factor 1 homolog [Anoplopoma fimbria]|uniref:RNA polymerase II-associated factor 1 homolog n=1 Tax=Anoplopoma fimbria TaxID=229290 RepID=UPI0023EC2B1E|nr:RNA polymerase II-associated factor 1 homolog [Anoplopoma fimbria]
MTTSPGTTPPPVKPQRSFRQNRQQEEQNTTAYLEGCDYMKEEAAAGESQKERNKGCDREAKEEREFSGFYLEDGGSRSETDEERCNEDVEEKDGREENEEWRQGEEVEEAGDQDISSKEDGGERRESEEDEKKGRDAKREEEEVDDGEKKTREEDGETDVSSEDDETGSGKHEDTNGTGIAGGGRGDNLSSPGRRSRVIRLYQYDEEGQRYGHLPDAAPDEQGPAPKLKQRSLSLTRLNAIMAAASAGPLDTMETGRGEREDRPHFHMEI